MIPSPGIELNVFICGNSIFLFSASLTIASPNGCSDPFSAAAANFNSSSSFIEADIISVTFGFPSVIVPVLSNTIVLILCASSSAT